MHSYLTLVDTKDANETAAKVKMVVAPSDIITSTLCVRYLWDTQSSRFLQQLCLCICIMPRVGCHTLSENCPRDDTYCLISADYVLDSTYCLTSCSQKGIFPLKEVVNKIYIQGLYALSIPKSFQTVKSCTHSFYHAGAFRRANITQFRSKGTIN